MKKVNWILLGALVMGSAMGWTASAANTCGSTAFLKSGCCGRATGAGNGEQGMACWAYGDSYGEGTVICMKQPKGVSCLEEKTSITQKTVYTCNQTTTSKK